MLTEQQLRHLEARLREERERALQVLRQFEESRDASVGEAAGDLTDYPFHVADHGTDSIDQEVDAVNAERTSHELEEIDDALRRLYEEPERFGICEDTGEPIPFERLDIVPWAHLCAEGGT
jgi:RNA polymerase-binding transcription factor DksA